MIEVTTAEGSSAVRPNTASDSMLRSAMHVEPLQFWAAVIAHQDGTRSTEGRVRHEMRLEETGGTN